MKLKLLILIFLAQFSLFGPAVFGQFCSKGGGGFTITPAIGCVGQSIQLKNDVPNGTTIKYVYNFNRQQTDFPSKEDETEELSHVYNSPGTYVILQYGSLAGSGFTACKDITIKETRPPKAELMACGNGKVRLTMVKDSITLAYEQIEINWGDGSGNETWTVGNKLVVDHKYKNAGTTPPVTLIGRYSSGSCQNATKPTVVSGTVPPPSLDSIRILSVEMQADGTAKVVYNGMDNTPTEVFVDKGDGKFVDTGKGGSTGGPQSATIGNLNPKQVYKFKLSSKNICDNQVESDVVSSMVLAESTVILDEINSITWQPFADQNALIEYQLKRDGVVVFTTTDLSYLDKDVKCGNVYKYELVAIVKDDVRSYSAPIEIEPKTAVPDVVSQANVTVTGSNVIETSTILGGKGLTSSFDLIVERAAPGSADWTKVSPEGNQNLVFTDSNVNTSESSYCYRFSYSNACKLGSPSFSEPVCSILLRRDAKEINWTNQSPFLEGTDSYAVSELDRGGAAGGEVNVGLTNDFAIDLNNQTISAFQVKASSASGNFTSVSNIVDFIREAIVLIPDAFTPNGDNINERFEIKSYFTDSFSMSIFNRWGEMVFQTNTAQDGWDGNYKGITAPGGYYFYKVDIVDTKGQMVSKSGSLLLIR